MKSRTRRVRSPETRRDEILNAALALFREHGYAAASMQQIAATAGVAIGTVYLYYPSKDQVLVECHRRFRDHLAHHVEQAVLVPLLDDEDVDLRAALETVVQAIAEFATANRELCQVALAHLPAVGLAEANERIIQVFTAVLDAGRRRGLVHATDPEVMATLLGRMLGHSVCSAAAFGTPPLERVVPVATEIAYRALAARTDDGPGSCRTPRPSP